jgi:acetyl/propionyl-CoA carboxylase alpha subunit/acetyl-CoA carboxylase carboxyltransferase component
MPLHSLLVANRGEIAIRVMRAAAARGLRSVAVHSEDEAGALHVRKADAAQPLRGSGAAAYLDIDGMLDAARAAGCDALHPGYGFLSENAEFARRCGAAGITFVGPSPAALDLFGDKARARALAQQCGIPVLTGTSGATSLDAARALLESFGAGASLMIKAVAGGGGRGVRPVHSADELEQAFERCASEARSAFGSGDLYVERWLPRARHVEVQIAGDAGGAVVQFGERECSLQRRHQKLVEFAPAPWLDPSLRERLLAAAVLLARSARYTGLGTVEFLVDDDAPGSFYFIEANARLQVEHTVTEAVTGVDLVVLQLDLAEGRSLAELGYAQAGVPAPRGYAVQLRVNTEKLRAKDGLALPASGTLSAFEPPAGPGVRTDTAGHVGYASNPRFDSLLAKVIVHSPSKHFADLLPRAARALAEFHIEGIETNRGLLLALLRHPALAEHRVTTRFVEENSAELVAAAAQPHPRLFLEPAVAPPASGFDRGDPLAVLAHGKSPIAPSAPAPAPPGAFAVRAPLSGTVASFAVGEGDAVAAGRALLVLEAMKMEHVIEVDRSGIVRALAAALGETVAEGQPLVWIEEAEVATGAGDAVADVDPGRIRPDLAEVVERHALGYDVRRPDAVARRRKTGQRTARENVEDLCDPDSFLEYGPLAIAAQRRRRTLEDLTVRTPADGLIAGIGSVNGDRFAADRARCAVLAYDYTVLAGTQGIQNHRKKDRLFELAAQWRLPVVIFTEGGGGRPGDTDGTGVAGLDCTTFHDFGALSGLVPLVAINSGRCFAGNAALLGCCDVVIATANSNIGMGGPAMIEGGGLGVFRPEEVGPIGVQVQNGVVDLPVEDEAEAVAIAKRYLAYFQGPTAPGESPDPRLLRHVIPENRLRVYDVRRVVDGIFDTGSVLELRRAFGRGMVTALARIDGAPIGVIANNPTHLSGAIDSDGADKATRFMQLCDAFDLPILFLCDTPGIMVGPEVEKTALVRHASRMFVTAGSLTVPFFTIILRKGYGLGAQAMAGGSFKAPIFCVSWPTGEFGGMGLEGAVKLGYRGELAALEAPEERRALFDQMVARMYQVGKAVNMSSVFEIDDVIDPADSRRWIARALASVPPPAPRTGKKRPCIDPW